jgi:hypothetical protein
MEGIPDDCATYFSQFSCLSCLLKKKKKVTKSKAGSQKGLVNYAFFCDYEYEFNLMIADLFSA